MMELWCEVKAVKNRENACSGTRQTNGRVPGYPLSPPQKKKLKKTEIFFLQSIKHIILYCGPFVDVGNECNSYMI